MSFGSPRCINKKIFVKYSKEITFKESLKNAHKLKWTIYKNSDSFNGN